MVATGSGLASLLKPMCVSLICTKVKSVVIGAAIASLMRSGRGTPPTTVQTIPVPAHAMHLSTPRRLGEFSESIFFLHGSVLVISKTAKAIEIFPPIGKKFGRRGRGQRAVEQPDRWKRRSPRRR